MVSKYAKAIRFVIAVACVTAAFQMIRLAYAEYVFREERPDAAELAARVLPGRADFQARAGNLERAIALNPYYAAAWVELGLRREREGDFGGAEQALRQAARVDRTFMPRWTLANYFYRRENLEEFWRWIRAAAELSYLDRSAVFQLCWRASQDSREILTRAIPPRHEVMAAYLSFLVQTGRFEAGKPVAAYLLAHGSSADAPRLIVYCDLLLSELRDAATAMGLWNGMIERGWLPYGVLDPAAGSVVTNGDFRVAAERAGFGWRRLPGTGVRVVLNPGERRMVVGLDGSQPEDVEILTQWVPLEPGGRFAVKVSAESTGIGRDSGLRWQVVDGSSGESIAGSGVDGLGGLAHFTAPRRSKLGKLVLSYRRVHGTRRIAGTLLVSSVDVRRDPADRP